MLFLPNGQLPPKKSKSGIVRGKSSGGYWLRARANTINLNTPPMTLWRHIFGNAKRNWLSLGPTGANNAPTMGIDPQAAWDILAGTYLGILQNGLIQGDIQEEGFLIGCATPEAFQVMVQTTLASLGLPPAPTPALNTSYLASPTLTANTSLGPYDYILTVPPMPPTDPLTFSVGIGIFINSNTSDTFTPSIPPMPTGVTATLSAPTFTLTYDPISGSSSGGVTLTLTLAAYTPPLTASLSIGLASSSSSAALPLALAVTTGNLVPVDPSPLFAFPTGLSASTVYDSGYNVVGIALTYAWLSTDIEPFPDYPCTVAGLWMITASASYTSSYSAPPAATWSPILASGPFMPLPADLLAAWQDAYGPLPPKGEIKFQAQYVDPLTGCPGPALSCTAEWATGTLLGTSLSAYTGPKFGFLYPTSGSSFISSPGLVTNITIELTGYNGYTGTVTLAAKGKTPVPNGANNTSYALPAGMTITFDPPTIDIIADSPTTYSGDMIITGPPAGPLWQGTVAIEAADAIMTASTRILVTYTGTFITPGNYLALAPSTATIYTPAASTTALQMLLSNFGPGALPVSMLTTNSDPDYTFEFGTGGTASATATSTAITFALATGQPPGSFTGQTLTAAGYGPSGYNVTDAPIIANDTTTVTVLSNNNPAAMTSAGIAAIINSSFTVPPGTLTAPGTTAVVMFAETAAVFTMPNPSLQIEAASGKNSTYAILYTTSNSDYGIQFWPLASAINQPVPGSTNITLTLINTNPNPLTPTLSTFAQGNGVTLTLSTTTPTVPGSAGNVPGTTTVTATVTTTAQADLTEASPSVQLVSGATSANSIIFFSDTQYGPLTANASNQVPAITIPGSTTVTITVSNESNATATVSLATGALPTGVSVSFGTTTLTVGPGSTTAPATASTTALITASGSAAPGYSGVTINLTAPDYLPFNVPLTPLLTP